MAADGRAFGVALGFYCVIAVVVFIFFGFARMSNLCKKFYAPKRFTRGLKHKPKRLPLSFWGWLLPVYKTTEEELLRIAGFDAATYMRIVSFGIELFFYLTILCCAAILPVNLVGKQVYSLTADVLKPNNYTYWVPPPPPINAAVPPPPPESPGIQGINPPNFYVPTPPAPPGLIWWKYADGVPPIPPLGPEFAGYGVKYDPSWRPKNYVPNNMDTLTMSNVENRSNLLWIHCLMTYIVSFVVFNLLWKYSKAAVALRLRFLQQAEGVQARTALVQDIPGVHFGTLMHRADTTVLRVLPGIIKEPLKKTVSRVVDVGNKGLKATTGRINNALVSREEQQPQRKGSESMFFEAPEALPSRGSIPSVHAVDPQIEAARQELIESQQMPLVHGGATSVIAPSDAASLGAWKARPTEEPEFANDPPELDAAFRSVTEQDPWAKAEALLEDGLTVQQMVEQEYVELFPGEVEAVHVVYDLAALNGLCKEYDTLKRNLEDLVDDYTSKKRRHKPIKRKQERVAGVKYGAWGRDRYGVKPVKVDTLEFYRDRMNELRRLILQEQKRTKDKSVPSAFVTFKKYVSQTKATTCTQHHDTSTWKVSAAPGHEEVIWGNLRWRQWERSSRFVAVWAAFFVMTAFYLIPIIFIQGLININQLRRVHVFAVIIDLPVVSSIVTAILPGLVLKIFLAVLPSILAFMGRLQGLESKSSVDFSVITKYYTFQFITVFLGSFVAGSVLNQAKELINNPTSIISILGTSAPLTSVFFLTFIELNALAATPVGFLRIVGLVLFWLLSRLAATERAKARLWQRQTMKYGPILPQHTITILLGLVFCIMNPIMCPMCLIYFLITTSTEKYNLLYVYTPEYESGGELWPAVYWQVIAALFTFQLFMIGILGAKGSYTSSVVVPLLFITAIFARVCSGIFKRPFEVMSLRNAVDLDKHEQDLAGLVTEDERREEEKAYLAPALKFDEEAHEQLMAEARQMDSVLKGEQAVAAEADEDDDEDRTSTADGASPRAPLRPPQRRGTGATGDNAV
ncbi:g5626 [Coccomyxa elongata]